jgi:DNA-binding GntR family transcriptional regulator
MSFYPAKASTLQESVYAQILEAIISGSIPGGAQVTTRDLAEKMSVSIQPVREAIVRLQELNLVVIENRRITITPDSIENMNDFTRLRHLVEGFAIELTCQRRSDETVAQLEAIIGEMKRSDITPSEYLNLNRELHRIIYAEARFPELEKIIEFLWLHVTRYLKVLGVDEELQSTTREYHERMVEAIRNRDVEAARKWLREDLETGMLMARRLHEHRLKE